MQLGATEANRRAGVTSLLAEEILTLFFPVQGGASLRVWVVQRSCASPQLRAQLKSIRYKEFV
jgi:hypothetical protein